MCASTVLNRRTSTRHSSECSSADAENRSAGLLAARPRAARKLASSHVSRHERGLVERAFKACTVSSLAELSAQAKGLAFCFYAYSNQLFELHTEHCSSASSARERASTSGWYSAYRLAGEPRDDEQGLQEEKPESENEHTHSPLANGRVLRNGSRAALADAGH